jgi:divalent metal cation (Fe/Co/Zn/Cd) transporter
MKNWGYQKMDIGEFIGSAIMIVVGAYIFYVIIQSLSQTDPGFAQYGWYLFGAFIVGAAIFLKCALSQRR